MFLPHIASQVRHLGCVGPTPFYIHNDILNIFIQDYFIMGNNKYIKKYLQQYQTALNQIRLDQTRSH